MTELEPTCEVCGQPGIHKHQYRECPACGKRTVHICAFFTGPWICNDPNHDEAKMPKPLRLTPPDPKKAITLEPIRKN